MGVKFGPVPSPETARHGMLQRLLALHKQRVIPTTPTPLPANEGSGYIYFSPTRTIAMVLLSKPDSQKEMDAGIVYIFKRTEVPAFPNIEGWETMFKLIDGIDLVAHGVSLTSLSQLDFVGFWLRDFPHVTVCLVEGDRCFYEPFTWIPGCGYRLMVKTVTLWDTLKCSVGLHRWMRFGRGRDDRYCVRCLCEVTHPLLPKMTMGGWEYPTP